MDAALTCWRPWLVEVASTGVAAVGAMQEPRLAMPPELIRKRAVVAEQCVVVETAITVLGTTTGTGILTA